MKPTSEELFKTACKIREDHKLSVVQITIAKKDSSIENLYTFDPDFFDSRVVFASVQDEFIINLAMDNLFHLLSNNNNVGEPMEEDYIGLCNKLLLLKLRDKINDVVNTIYK